MTSFTKKTLRLSAVLFLVSLGIFILSLWRRIIHIDDVWLGEYSYWLSQLGYVKSEAMRGFFNAENKLFVYHKLFNIEGALLIHWFGFKAYVLKSLSLIYLALSLIVLAQIYRKHSQSGKNVLLLLALFLAFFHTVNLGFTFRPEMHLVFYALLSFLFLDKYFETGRYWQLSLSAFVCGLSIATHLNGIVITGAGVLLLWCSRRWLAGFVYGLIACWGVLFYLFFDARSVADLQLHFQQLTHWRDVATGKYGWELLFRVFEEQGRYLHSPPEILYTLMLLLLLIPARKYLRKNQGRVCLYQALLCLCVAEVTHGTNTNYLMYAFPFFILLAVWSFESLLQSGRRKLAWSAVLIYSMGSWAYNLKEFSHREVMAPEYAKVAAFIPQGVYVLAPAHLMFSGLGKFHIQSFINYRDKVENGVLEPTPEALFAEAAKFANDYVVVDTSNANFFGIKEDHYGEYSLLPTQPSESFRIYMRMR